MEMSIIHAPYPPISPQLNTCRAAGSFLKLVMDIRLLHATVPRTLLRQMPVAVVNEALQSISAASTTSHVT